MAEFLEANCGRSCFIFHDAIPMQYPEISFPHRVACFPEYMKTLSRADLVLAVSKNSADVLQGYWRWLEIKKPPPVLPISLGADSLGYPRRVADQPSMRSSPPHVVSLGILEPRKNQACLLDAAEILWDKGIEFSVTLAGRFHPRYGQDLRQRLHRLRRKGRAVRHLDSPPDSKIADVLNNATLCIQLSKAEGCGLPLLEALWHGVPVLASDIPSHRESAAGGGCQLVASPTPSGIAGILENLFHDPKVIARLRAEALDRKLPTWSETAILIKNALGTYPHSQINSI